MLASTPLFPKFVTECAATYHELRKRGTSVRGTLPLLKYEKRSERNERKSDRMVPAERLLEVQHREGGEHHERDDLLHGLELRRRVDRVAPAVGWHRQAIFDQRDAPGREDDAGERHLLEAQVAVPGERH